MSISEKLQRSYDSGEWATLIKNNSSERSMLSRWSKKTGVRYASFPFNKDRFVFFCERAVDKVMSE